MATTQELRGKIRAARNTQQITKALELVSSSKLRRAQARLLASRPYADLTQDMLRSVAAQAASADVPLLAARGRHRVLVLPVTSDKGLCGSFNSNVLRLASALLREFTGAGAQVQMLPMGRKAVEAFRPGSLFARSLPAFSVLAQIQNLPERPGVDLAGKIAQQVIGAFTAGTADEVHLVYTRFVSTLNQRAVSQRLLPVEVQQTEGIGAAMLFEPSPDAVMNQLIPRVITTLLLRAILESTASEHAARRVAMQNATDNAQQLIRALQLQYNRARQASITTELIEIVSGANALAAEEE